MRIILLATVLALAPAAAFAQVSGALNTSAGGSASGGVDTSVDTSAGGAVHQPSIGGSNPNEPPLDVRRYIESHPAAPATGGGSLGAGDSLPNGATVREVPGYPQWGYSSNGGQDVIVNRSSGAVVDTVGK
jgi:hypothetical protein